MTKKKKKQSALGKNSVWLLAMLLLAMAWELYSSDGDKGSELTIEQAAPLMDVVIPAGTPSQILHYPGFTVDFNPEYHQPNWVAWELTRAEAQSAESSRKNSAFAPDLSVEGCATLADYKNSGYDRGHLCPAGDMKWSQESMDACFLLTNMSPQDHQLNNGAWKNLEEKCRTWAIRDSAIIIICGPVLTDKLPRSIGQTPVPVPERFFKVVLAPYANPVRAIGFIMPNSKVAGGMQATAVSVDEVEQITGFDFFSALPDDIENRVEAECNFPRWEKKN